MNAIEYKALAETRADPENGMRTVVGIATGRCEGCGGCCGRVLHMSRAERSRLLDYVRDNHVEPHGDWHQMCALLDPVTRRCRAYAARPLICRVWDSPTHAAVAGDPRAGQPCGMRLDRARLMARKIREMDEVDTWELFGLVEAEGS